MSTESHDLQTRTARTTVKVASFLCVIKLGAFALSASSGVLGSAADSALDMVASLVVLWAVTAAARPADADHPFGHGKAESLASLLQSILILVSGLGLAYHSIHRALTGDHTLSNSGIGIAVMIGSSAVTLWLVRRLRQVAEETGSPAIGADSAHYASDLATNLAAALGLLLYLFTDSIWPDLLVGLAIALVILNTAREVFTGATDGLMDKGVDSEDEAAVLRTIMSFAPRVAGFHDLRSRRSGAETFFELHLDIPRDVSFVEAHDLAEEVGEAIENAVPRSQVTVHADPL